MNHVKCCRSAFIVMLALCWVINCGQKGLAYTFRTIDNPLAGTGVLQGTMLSALDCSTFVGCYLGSSNGNFHAFSYDGSAFTAINGPQGAGECQAFDICGDNIVGYYHASGGNHGFLYDGVTWQTLDHPLATGSTYAYGIDGENIVGIYYASGMSHGFFYDGANYSTIDYPLAKHTYISEVDGDTLVGYYRDTADVWHGLIVTIPEPSAFVLLVIGSVSLLGYGWRPQK